MEFVREFIDKNKSGTKVNLKINLSLFSKGTIEGGVYTNIDEINIFNTTIDCFNKEQQMDRGERYSSFGEVWMNGNPHRNELKYV